MTITRTINNKKRKFSVSNSALLKLLAVDMVIKQINIGVKK